MNDEDSKVIGIIADQIEPMKNPFDSDARYNNENAEAAGGSNFYFAFFTRFPLR